MMMKVEQVMRQGSDRYLELTSILRKGDEGESS